MIFLKKNLGDQSSSVTPYDSLIVSDLAIKHIRSGMTISIHNIGGEKLWSNYYLPFNDYVLNSSVGSVSNNSYTAKWPSTSYNMTQEVLVREVDKKTNTIYFDRQVKGNLLNAFKIVCNAKPVLNFHKQEYKITAINIINELLFWTDNITEPKK